MGSGKRRLLGLTTVGVALASVAVVAVADAGTSARSDRTSRVESARVDSVPTPVLRWQPCNESAECATVALPVDYDQPRGSTVDVAVLRVKAKDQERRIGSLFVNPGGPSLPARDFALEMAESLGAEVLNRFDIVGFDPRGVGASRCCGARSATRS
ncbi:hypothetical protein [Jidongwangia harbinensis]|uniref:hypothetical protein n=1 Tax=Jidongwangia harbinensis TaxID=2878561 RepID=UPI001CD9A73A|nr:hypothetical protein [Jidongwangia harbinensis]MCA2218411.1 hypothetical protein [Jidongwangia harbinensis]